MKNKYPKLLIITGAIGILTSLMLTLDKIELLKNPGAQLPCNINPLVSCGPVINTWQAEVFGIPNPLIGAVGFALVLMTGAMLMFGAEPSRKFWKFFTVGVTFAILFIHWLIFQSIFNIGALCIYCMITWVAVWPLFFFTIVKNIEITPPNPLLQQEGGFRKFLLSNKYQIFAAWYVAILLIILFHFRDFFFS